MMKGIVLDKTVLEGFNKKLVKIQKVLHKSNGEMAEMLGVARDTYRAYRSGRRKVPADVIYTLIEEYGINPEYILCDDEKISVLRETVQPIETYYARIDGIERDIVMNSSGMEFSHKKMIIRRLLHFILVMIDDL